MKITSTEEYGLRCLLRVAEAGAPVTAQYVADKEGISVAYTQKLLRTLSQGGILESKRGAKGGFHLVRPAALISVGDALRSLGATSDMDSFCDKHSGDLNECCRTDTCSIQPVWTHVLTVVMATLDNLPISTLLTDAQTVSDELEKIVQIPNVMFCPIAGAEGASS